MALDVFARMHDLPQWKEDKKNKATVTKGALGKNLIALMAPDTFMNKSGNAVGKYVKSPKAASQLTVVYDDLDLPLGTMKLSFDRGSGGHKGLESIIRAVKTKKFTRVRIGVSPAAASGTVKKPSGDKAINNFILGKFSANEMEELKKVFKRAAQALATIVEEGPSVAMNKFN